MKNKITTIITSFALVLGFAALAIPAASTGAIDVFSGSGCPSGTTNSGGQGTTPAPAPAPSSGGSAGQTAICGATSKDELPSLIKNVINILLFIVGVIAVIAIVIGGIRYTTSNGDSSQTKAAKDTILYAVVGLVVAILAFAIVNFVVTQFA
ncbi:hypothetical protein HY312_04625 [Candidatus Saccharibacteria bacterium]|nr:hypothetical protein [Candidatus Saccharibacteria bacterium]